jgi:cell division protein FtsN
LQVGAFASRDEAQAAWKTFKSRHSAVVRGLSEDIQAADVPGKGTWYRLRIGPFADKAEASALCTRLKADNAGCFVTAP